MNKQKIVNGQIADASGHTDFQGTLDEAMTIIMDSVKKAGKWAYINGNPFIFQSFDAAEETQAKEMLAAADEPHFVLTGKLQGGAASAPIVQGRITSKPISQAFKPKQRLQLGVSISTDHGQELVDVVITTNSGGRAKLQKHQQKILAAIFNALRDEASLKADAKANTKS